MASYSQARALCLIFLIAGHEAVRVRETINIHNFSLNPRQAAEDEWQTENEACKLELLSRNPGCKGEGCSWRALPFDAGWPFSSESCRLSDEHMLKNRAHYFQLQARLLAAKSAKFSEKCKDASSLNRKCARRAKHVYRAMKYLSKAQDSSLIESLSEDQKEADRALFEESLSHMSGMAGPDGNFVLELTEKMKQRKGHIKEDPLGAVQSVVKLLTMLLKGSAEEKERARTEIREMEVESDEDLIVMEAEDEREYVRKLEIGAQDIRENLDSAALDLDRESDGQELMERESNGNVTALMQLYGNATSMMQRYAGNDDSTVMVVKGIAFVVILVLVVSAIVWAVMEIVAILVAWALISVIGCSAYSMYRDDQVQKGKTQKPQMGVKGALKCMAGVFAMPFVYAYKGGRYVYRLIQGKKKSEGQGN